MKTKSILESKGLAIASVAILAVIMSCTSKKVVKDTSQMEPSSVTTETEVQPPELTAKAVESVPMTHFAFDSAVLTKQGKALVRNQAREIKKSARSEVVVIGACDERGSIEYNQKLGMRRASAVRAELEKFGVPARLIRIQSVGKTHAIALGHDEQSWAENRRAEMHVNVKTPLASR
jgi:peptidoglycan-associated lipoprotein